MVFLLRSASRSPLEAFCEFCKPKISEAAWRACSDPCFGVLFEGLNTIFNHCRELGDRRTSRSNTICETVAKRRVVPGLPDTKTSSPSPAPLRIPLQVMLGVDGLAVLIDAKQREIDVVAGICEVIWIAAEERGLLLGRKHHPDVGVFLIAIEPIFAA